MNEFTVRLDLAKGKARQQQTVFVRQGDKNATTIVATITDHGAAAATSGLTARFQMRLPNGTHYYRKAASLSGNTATVTIDEAQAASIVGRTDVAYFQLLQGSTVVASTESFSIVVLPDALADAEVAESYDSAIQDAIDALDAAVEQMPDMVEDVLTDHPEWTTTVQDGSITQAKLATDLARDRERLLYRLANMLTASLPEGETATASDAAKTPTAGLALYGRSTQDGTPTPSAPVAIVSVEGINLLDPAESVAPATIRGLTATYEGDGWFRVSGTVTSGGAGILLLWGSSDASYNLLDGGDYALTIENDGLLSANIIGLQVYGVNVGGTTDYAVYYDDLPRYIPASKMSDHISRVCIYYTAAAAGTSVNGRIRVQMVAGSTAYPYVPYGYAGLLARGRNLLDVTVASYDTSLGIAAALNADKSVTLSGTSRGAGDRWLFSQTSLNFHGPSGDVTFSARVTSGAFPAGAFLQFSVHDASTGAWKRNVRGASGATSVSGRVNDGEIINVLGMYVQSGITFSVTLHFQFERGSTAHAYEPYTATTTPIDLDGHELRSLPDGTRDELTVGADGHAVLVQRVQLTTQAVTDGVTGTVGVDVMSSTGAIANGATVLYKLATPVTHDLGYVAAVPLCGPDLTAQAIPTAPFALIYERDLNATLARLESAIADVATS